MFILLAIIVLLIYWYFTRNFDYWAKRNVKHEQPVPLFGNHFRNVFGIRSITEISMELYDKYSSEKVVGYYRGATPELIIRDPDIVRRILSVDFDCFHRRGLGRNPEVDPTMLNLFNVDGDKWKLLRRRLTPAFTTNKLKNMFPLVVKCAEKLQVLAGERDALGVECDVREMMARFTTEFIGACGFGIEMDTINDDHSQFRELGRLIFTPDLMNKVLSGAADLLPEISNNLRKMKKEVADNIMQLFKTIRENRNYKPIGRNDFIDLLLELELMGTIKGDSVEKRNLDGSPVQVEMELDIATMAAQVFIFFAAGFETSSSATSFTLHQLALNPDVQKKIQEEIDEVLIKYDSKLCYDAIAEMPYLDQAFSEGMRMFPSLGCLNRVCVRKYEIPELNITIDPGVKILIPVQALQNDERYFDNPTEFRPDRFLPEEAKGRHKYVYLPFGDGPRACIGARLGQMQSLAGLAALLHQYSVEPSPRTPRKLTVHRFMNVVQGIEDGIPLMLRKRFSNKSN